ncbi:MAG: Rid family detoxifying hydrolase [Propionibacteriaceae bacterium]|jgi:2-iminobutanoate/2-iminopropanoate deaminase|nr:Rid family detoxifying hydrolase [Propionibacteriaceae bacterium]
MSHSIVNTDKAPAAIGPYSQAVATPDTVYCSGQVPIVPASGTIEAADIAGQTQQVLTNIQAVLAEADLTLANVVKTTIFLTDLANFQAVNRIYGEHFSGPVLPARSTVQVVALPMGALIEIEVIAQR